LGEHAPSPVFSKYIISSYINPLSRGKSKIKMAKNNGPQKEKPSWEGHRGRLRKRFLEGGLEGFLD